MFQLLYTVSPTDIMLDIFDGVIFPVLSYGCEIWEFKETDIKRIEVLLSKFLKYILKANSQTTNCMVYGKTGRRHCFCCHQM